MRTTRDSSGEWREAGKVRQLVTPSVAWKEKAAEDPDVAARAAKAQSVLSTAELERLAVAEILRSSIDPAVLAAKVEEIRKRSTAAVAAGETPSKGT